MIHSALVKFLNKHVYIQIILCFLPTILVAIYAFAYVQDVYRVVGTVIYNDSLTKEDMDNGYIKEVVDYRENELSDTYRVTIVSDNTFELEVTKGDPIYYIYILDKDWFRIVTDYGSNQIYTSECNFIDEIKESDGSFEVKKDDVTAKLDSGSLLATVFLTKDGEYRVEYGVEDFKELILEELPSLEVKLNNRNSCRFLFHDGYNLELDDISINFCSNLPTDNIYYNEFSRVFIKNISSDFAKIFILDSNIILLFVTLVVFIAILWFIRMEDKLIFLKRKSVMVCNTVAVAILPLCVLITFTLL